ncbi:arylamine N-acetyltransferase family protein [Microbulbifer halophilus]|uniref:Arylamine N-acetyltransferase n=1 Tax=Microbulbifer halophilus TaxID=453963 RepID=A0ABW5ECV6_9GAMM|nr:arylamine N-acetyltransferase [Microbulbifer halophilus]MCW8127219.1 arylamine N-acetyltransferase [Microbulbifer halophilus]
MGEMINLDAYLQRIDFSGSPAADLDSIKKLVARHTRAISFENLNPFFGWPVEIDLPAVERKLVHSRRGGYCYEQNTLMQALLESLDVPVTPLAARVLWQAPEDSTPAQSHMMLRAEIGGKPYLVDVGFGVQTPTAPLRLDTEAPQDTPHGCYRVLQADGEFLVQVALPGSWAPIYRFDLQRQAPDDYKMFNWYCSTHPDSHFTRDLIATRPVESGRYTLHNNKLTFYPLDGPKRESSVAGPEELRRQLRDVFDIELPDSDVVTWSFSALFAGTDGPVP